MERNEQFTQKKRLAILESARDVGIMAEEAWSLCRFAKAHEGIFEQLVLAGYFLVDCFMFRKCKDQVCSCVVSTWVPGESQAVLALCERHCG